MDYAEISKQGLEHVSKHLDHLSTRVEKLSKMVEDNEGDPYACIQGLRGQATAASLVSWFRDHSLSDFKKWCYVAGKLDYILFKREPRRWYPAYLLLMPLLSDNERLIQWLTQSDQLADVARAHQPAAPEFHGYQALVALRGDWKLLEERSLQAIGHSSAKMQKYEIDHHFYLALARHDVPGMEAVLQKLVSPKTAKARNVEPEFGFTEKLIGTHAVIYAKIAWRHGFEVKVDTPWIPQEWLPIAPLAHYTDPYNFMKQYEI
ncbi:Imm49 family immunity protein [Burkholderia pyrrocinia]|uniref:Imm49 family immunity protein n=1 Tax=Burkholderia pyrrocinia TaxID=60550 RepID=UPI00158B8707|nr:Imm49 family immunity protein [Burkholderia pyrrocinia]